MPQPDRRNKILLEVRETNLAAQLFFRAMGFRAVSLLRAFYENTTEDAYLFQYRYQATAEALAADDAEDADRTGRQKNGGQKNPRPPRNPRFPPEP